MAREAPKREPVKPDHIRALPYPTLRLPHRHLLETLLVDAPTCVPGSVAGHSTMSAIVNTRLDDFSCDRAGCMDQKCYRHTHTHTCT